MVAVGLWIYFSPYQSCVRAGAQPIECAIAPQDAPPQSRIALRSIRANAAAAARAGPDAI